jgi:hypothetical protein
MNDALKQEIHRLQEMLKFGGKSFPHAKGAAEADFEKLHQITGVALRGILSIFINSQTAQVVI